MRTTSAADAAEKLGEAIPDDHDPDVWSRSRHEIKPVAVSHIRQSPVIANVNPDGGGTVQGCGDRFGGETIEALVAGQPSHGWPQLDRLWNGHERPRLADHAERFPQGASLGLGERGGEPRVNPLDRSGGRQRTESTPPPPGRGGNWFFGESRRGGTGEDPEEKVVVDEDQLARSGSSDV